MKSHSLCGQYRKLFVSGGQYMKSICLECPIHQQILFGVAITQGFFMWGGHCRNILYLGRPLQKDFISGVAIA